MSETYPLVPPGKTTCVILHIGALFNSRYNSHKQIADKIKQAHTMGSLPPRIFLEGQAVTVFRGRRH